jgi:WD40 repeat protein
MAAPEVHHLFHHPIADHSFSADRRTLAVAKDNNVELYTKSGNKFTLKDELKGHDKTVTSVDIAPNSGMIVTCSQGKFDCGCSVSDTDWLLQTGTHMSGSLPQLAGSQLLPSFESTELLHLSDGLPPRGNSLWVQAPELLLSAISRKRMIGGSPNT